MSSEFGLKELYDVTIKTTSNIEVNGRTLEKGETFVAFDKIQIANFQEIRKITTANGGFDNRPHVWWETVKDVSLTLDQGVFSKSHFACMVNAKLFKIQEKPRICINKREELESNESGILTLTHEPHHSLFIYNKLTGNKLSTNEYQYLGNKQIQIDSAFTDMLIDYYYQYHDTYSYIQIGEELTHGYFSLEGKTRVKDDETGETKTGLLIIPRLKLVSDLSMRLGSEATPVMGSLAAVACPTGPKGNTKVMDIIFLNDDIDDEE